MSMEFRVELSEKFKEGCLNTPFFKDIPAMTDEELALLFQFMQDISAEKPLRGKNKPSWLDDRLDKIPHTETYQQCNIWHYHCGPYPESKKLNPMKNLKLNLNGETSASVIHYQKISETHIFIVAFSPSHEPFPKEADYPNPIIERTE